MPYKYNPLNIIIGTLILIIVSSVLLFSYNFAFMRLTSKEKKLDFNKLFMGSFIISLIWVLTAFLSVAIAAVALGVPALVALSFIMLAGSGYLLSDRFLNIEGNNRFIYSLMLAILFNPGWLTLLKVI
jgi:hypothetical protein